MSVDARLSSLSCMDTDAMGLHPGVLGCKRMRLRSVEGSALTQAKTRKPCEQRQEVASGCHTIKVPDRLRHIIVTYYVIMHLLIAVLWFA